MTNNFGRKRKLQKARVRKSPACDLEPFELAGSQMGLKLKNDFYANAGHDLQLQINRAAYLTAE